MSVAPAAGQPYWLIHEGSATEETLAAILTQENLNGGKIDTTNVVVARRFGVSTGSPVTASAAGDTTVHTPGAGNRIRLRWIGLSSPEDNTDDVLVKVYLGATEIYRWSMGAPGAFAHGAVREGGVDEVLKVNLSGAQTVHVNIDLEEF